MRVLLLSHNHTVREMVALALREMDDVELVVAQSADQVEPTTYDLIFVDDALPLYQESIALAQTLGVEAIVLLAQKNNADAARFAEVVRKPFLPAEIRERVEACSPVEEQEDERDEEGAASSHPTSDGETNVLDLDEIETIKALLEEEGLEIVNEEELVEKVIAGKATPDERHDALIAALRTMNPKKIRKLLKGATVRIEITFPEEG